MPNRRRRMNWKADLKWFLVFAAAAQFGLIFTADWRSPLLYDLEYGTRLDLLRRRTAEGPQRPVALVVGSSRLGLGFLPERLPPLRTADSDERAALQLHAPGGGAGRQPGQLAAPRPRRSEAALGGPRTQPPLHGA